MTDQKRMRVMRETQILEQTKHPYIIKMISYFIDAEKYVTKGIVKPMIVAIAAPEPLKQIGKQPIIVNNKMPPLAKKPVVVQKLQESTMMGGTNNLLGANLKTKAADAKPQLVDIVKEKWYLCIVMENASHGDVLQLIEEHKAKDMFIEESLIWRLTRQIA